MQIDHIYHDVKVMLNLTPSEIDNIIECKKDHSNPISSETSAAIYWAFYDSPTSLSYTSTLQRLIKERTPQICGYNELFVLHALAKSKKILPGLKIQIDNLWNAFDEHRKLLESFRYETKVQNGNTLDRGGGEKG